MTVNARRRPLVAKNSVDAVPSGGVGLPLRHAEVLSPPVAAESWDSCATRSRALWSPIPCGVIGSRSFPATGSAGRSFPPASKSYEALAEREGGFAWTFDRFDWGSDHFRATGLMMPRDGLEQIRNHDAIYFGAVGSPDVTDHVSLWGLRLAICQPFDQYANVRPARVLPGIASPLRAVSGPELDWVIVRENSEGEYAGAGGRVHQGLPAEVATDVTIMTRAGVDESSASPSHWRARGRANS